MYLMVCAAILIPPSFGGLLATSLGFYPFPEFYYGLADLIGIYISVVLIVALLCVRPLHRTIVDLAKANSLAEPETASKTLFRINVALWMGIFVYTVFGAVVSGFSMQHLGYQDFDLSDHLWSQIMVLPVVLLTTFPIFFIFFDKIGLYLAPRGVRLLAVSIRTKIMLFGIVSPFLANTIIVGHFYNQTGYFSLTTLAAWVMVMLLSVIGAYLVWGSLKQGIQPLKTHMTHHNDQVLAATYQEVPPASLDEFGVLTASFNQLEQRRFELMDQIKAESERSQTLLESMATVVVVLTPDNTIDYVNPAFEKLSGRSQAELKGKNWLTTFVPQADQMRVTQLLQGATTAPQTGGSITPIKTKSGKRVEIEWNDTPIFNADGTLNNVIGTGIDVSERIAAQRDLEASEQRFRIAERIAGIGNWQRTGTGEMIFSAGALRILGAAGIRKNWTESSFLSQIHPDDLEQAKATICQTNKGADNAHSICRLTRLDGHERLVQLEVGQGSSQPDGDVSNFGVIQDITKASIIEEKLRQAQKMEAVGNMTGGVAHDFNNLLAVTLGNLELLRKVVTETDQVTMIDAGINATLRGADLTKKMLSFARRAYLDVSVVMLNDIVEDTQQWIGRTLPANIEVETSLHTDLWAIEADATSIESALLNLVLNARDAMPEGGKLRIKTTNITVERDDIESSSEDIDFGQYVMLEISDTGHGIDTKTKERIFDPFFTTKPPGAGSGLGLSMVQGFMKQSGGAVQVVSEPGKGTTFKLYFRAWLGTEKALESKSTEVTKSTSSNARILLAEDEPEVRNVIVAVLKKHDYQVTAVMSGDEALSTFEQDSDFDILVTDIVMPGHLQGTQLAASLRDIKPDLPVVFMSGYTSKPTVYGNGLRPEDIRLMKPVRQVDLVTAIEKALQHPK
jgi:PAS domain S-box-containing protein